MTNYKQRIAEFNQETVISRPLMAMSLLEPILTDMVADIEALKAEVAKLQKPAPAAKTTRTATAEK